MGLTSADSLHFQNIEVAAQNAHALPSGAYTGEVSINQLKDIHLKWVILGHSERRTLFHESSETVAEKTAAAIKLGIQVILCVGENLEQREKNITKDIVTAQLDAVNKAISKADWDHVVIAYEPVWAIGTGKVATPEVAQETHADIRAWLKHAVGQDAADKVRIIYGGSVAAKNCVELGKKPDIDGFLVGGASLKPEFVDIINAVKAKL